MKHAKKKKKMMYKKGGKLKPVDSVKNPGLAKLPKDVRKKKGCKGKKEKRKSE